MAEIITYKCPNGHVVKWRDPGGGCMVRRRSICPKCGEWSKRQEETNEEARKP